MKKKQNHSGQLALDFDSVSEVDSIETTKPILDQTGDARISHVSIRVPPDLRFPYEHCLNALTDWTLFPRLLTIQEAAWLTQVPVKTLYKWNAQGKLKKVATTLGKQLRFDREALLQMWTHETSKSSK
jgi:excisionase family DNA binding protein